MAIPSNFDITQLHFPEEYINSAKIAGMLVDEAVESHHSMWESIDEIEEHLAGEPPVDEDKVRDNGLDWISNRNFGKARAKIEKGTSQNSAAVMDSISLAGIEFKNDDSNPFVVNPKLRESAATIIANALVDALQFDSRFHSLVAGIERSSYSFGFCPVTSSQHDWIGDWHHPRNIAFEPESTPEDIRTWVVFDCVKADVLYREYIKVAKQIGKKEKDPDNVGGITVKSNWVEEGLAEVLYHAYSGVLGHTTDDDERIPETWEQVLNDFCSQPQEVIGLTPDINIAKIYRREFDGSFSEIYMAYNNTFPEGRTHSGQTVGGKFHATYLLYKKNHGTKTQDDVITILRDSGYAANGNISELRGIAKFAYDDSVSFNRLKNDLNNKLTLSQPTFERVNSQMAKKFQLAVYSGYNIAPRGFQLTEKQFTANLNAHMLMLQLDEKDYSRDTTHYDSNIDDKLTSRPTTAEVQQKTSEATRSKRGRIEIRLRDYSKLMIRMLRDIKRLRKIAEGRVKDSIEYFYDRIKFEISLIPDLDATFDVDTAIDAVTRISLDPVLSDAEVIERSLLIAESPNARNKLRRMLLLAYGFSRAQINDILPPVESIEREFTDARIASMENADLASTREVAFFKSDDHIVHLDMHFSKLARLIDGLAQGGDLEKSFIWGINMLSHTEKHVDAMRGSPFFGNRFKRYSKIQVDFVRQMNKLRPAVQRIIEKKQKEENTDAEMEKVKLDSQIKWFQALDKIKRTDALSKDRSRQQEEMQEFKKQLEQDSHEFKLRHEKEMNELKKEFAILDEAFKLQTAA